MGDITVFFKKSQDYREIPVSGAWGGLSPQGMVYCDLFVEKAENPESIVFRIDENNQPQEVSRQPQTTYFIREALVGLMMQPDVARSIGQWLVWQADEFDKGRRGP